MTSEYYEAERDPITLPRSGTKFRVSIVEAVIKEVCHQLVGEQRPYVYDEVQPLIKEICSEIQQRVVRLGYERYKLVTHVTIVEAAHQGIRIASRGLWDPVTDGYATYTHSTETMHVNVILYALYWE
ncbi:Tctex-1 [Trypanosoma melophagium]|uniref:Tctex-1 n=1 Tax=Trypanosoma melophagium TaxID=715481 RepID=UPI00351A0C71|nr:Tctex-1 [Trypanosoma melophagium]